MLALGGAYGYSAARAIEQRTASQLLADASYFATGASQALRANDPAMIATELERYGALYSSTLVIFDRTGQVWATSGAKLAVSDEAKARVDLALSGRRGEPVGTAIPWVRGPADVHVTEISLVEPVFADGVVVGAFFIATSTDGAKRAILAQWAVLGVLGVGVIALLVWVVYRLSNWVLKPLRKLDSAMAAIEHGEMNARISDDTGPPEVRRMVRMFNQMADEIERVMTRQQEFVMNASHELRNPLGALLLRVEYLATGLDEGWIDDIEHAREEGRRMTRILDTLLSVARDGKADSAFGAVDLFELIENRAAGWRERAAADWVVLRTTREGEAAPANPFAVTDRMAVETALDAILDNALKFAPRGSVIDLGVSASADGHRVTVRDRGRGLDTEQLERATDRFWRSPHDQNVPGSGLGLAIAHDLMETLGGSIELASPDGGGLCVTLWLPGGEAAAMGADHEA